MTWRISIGTLILALIVARFLWRLTHPVAPESSLPSGQRITSVMRRMLPGESSD
jgi:cytochrome b561